MSLGSQTLLWSPVADYAPGALIAEKYRLLRFLGEGSQGQVWLAENLSLRAECAIKLVRGGPDSAMPMLRLEKEARFAAQIPHPASVRVFDLGWTATGDTFIVMEFLQGESLGERLTTCGRLSPVEAVRTLLPIADVLSVLHQRRIVHRDLKPENVFLAKSGASVQPKLLDFGIAKRRPDGAIAEPAITDVGALVGTPEYSSPEQVDCRQDIGQTADIWSFCVVLYECLTGLLPFESETYDELFRRIECEPPVSILAHGAGDLELWEIVRRGLSKDPSARWPDMQSLGRALARWLRARGVEDDISGIRLDARWLPKTRGDPVVVAASAPVPVNRLRGGDPADAIGVRPTVHTVRRSRGHWLGIGVAAAVPVVLGYTVAAPRSAGPQEQRKPVAPFVIELPPESIAPAKDALPAPTPDPQRLDASPKPVSSKTPENKPDARQRKPLDLIDPY